MTDAEILSRADRARDLLDNQEFENAVQAVRQALLDRFEECPIRDKEGQHEIKLMLKLLGDVKANLQSVVDSGKVVTHRISMLDRARKGIHAFRN
jgi:hypothetical protein